MNGTNNMNIRKELETKVGTANGIYLNNLDNDPLTIKEIKINDTLI